MAYGRLLSKNSTINGEIALRSVKLAVILEAEGSIIESSVGEGLISHEEKSRIGKRFWSG